MILQTLDIKDNCKGIFHEDSFLFNNIQDIIKEYTLAWKHSPLLDDEVYHYLYLHLKGEDLSNYCHDPELFRAYEKKMKSHQKAAMTAKVSLEEECFFDLIPKHHLVKWFRLRQSALINLHKSTPKSDDYEILHKIHVLTTSISQQNVLFENKKGRIIYDIFGSAPGR